MLSSSPDTIVFSHNEFEYENHRKQGKDWIPSWREKSFSLWQKNMNGDEKSFTNNTWKRDVMQRETSRWLPCKGNRKKKEWETILHERRVCNTYKMCISYHVLSPTNMWCSHLSLSLSLHLPQTLQSINSWSRHDLHFFGEEYKIYSLV